ncbi:hypothetical protein D3C86_1785300 [compost metagenome]
MARRTATSEVMSLPTGLPLASLPPAGGMGKTMPRFSTLGRTQSLSDAGTVGAREGAMRTTSSWPLWAAA